MQETNLREKYISYLMQSGIGRKEAEETVDITDDDGNVIGLISEDALHFEVCIRDALRLPDVREELAKHILETNPELSDKLRHILKEDIRDK